MIEVNAATRHVSLIAVRILAPSLVPTETLPAPPADSAMLDTATLSLSLIAGSTFCLSASNKVFAKAESDIKALSSALVLVPSLT